MATDQLPQDAAESTLTLQDLTKTTEQWIQLWLTELRRHPTHADRVEGYRQQCIGAVHLWSFLAIQKYRIPAEVERAEYDRLRTLVEDAARQAQTESRTAASE